MCLSLSVRMYRLEKYMMYFHSYLYYNLTLQGVERISFSLCQTQYDAYIFGFTPK
jgi:hypothetical protein